jgi:hypothetical protein
MLERFKETLNPKRIRFRNVYNDGCKFLIFVWCESTKLHTVLYALDDKQENHSKIYELALNDELVSEKCNPKGGGVYDARTGEYIRQSFYYGHADDIILNAINKKFRDLTDCI